MRLYPSYLLAQVRFEIVECIKMGRFAGDRTHLGGEVRSQLILLHVQQPAIRVVDDDELLRVQQVMRNNQRPYRVLGGNPARIADHVRVSGLQSQAAFKQDSGIHAGQHSQPPPRPDCQVPQVKVFYKLLVSFQQFVGN